MIIAISNQKGGTGKTTTTLNLGAALAHFHKKKVLLIDLDPQGSLTLFTGLMPEELDEHVGTVVANPSNFKEALVDYFLPSLKLLPGHASMTKLNSDATNIDWKEGMVKALKKANKQFDYVLIDCPPTLGPLAEQAMCVADQMIVPLQCEYMALRGVQLILGTLAHVQETCNKKLNVMGILPTMFDARTLHAKEVLLEIRDALDGQVNVFDTVIPRTVRFPESAVTMLPIFEYDPKNAAAKAYKKLAKEVVNHG